MLYFIIPAYNEEKNISSLLKTLADKMEDLKLPYELVIVNDGSKDTTKSIVEANKAKYPITLLNHEVNRNVGEVFRTGFKYALQRAEPRDVIITKEADNTSDLSILPDMLKKIEEGYDIALASCYANGGKIVGTTPIRIILSSVANFVLRTCFPIDGVRTYSSFYRAYKASMLKEASEVYKERLIEESGFVCMVELLIKLSKLPIKITEVPMILRCDFRKGKSKMNKWRTMLAYFRLIFKEIIKKSRKTYNVKIQHRSLNEL